MTKEDFTISTKDVRKAVKWNKWRNKYIPPYGLNLRTKGHNDWL